MRAVNCPIDTSLNFSQAKKLVRDLKPGIIAVPKCYTLPPPSASQRTDLQLEVDVPVYTFSRDESVKLPVASKFEKITIDPGLASKLTPTEVKPGVSVATVTGNLKVINNKYKLADLEDLTSSDRKRSRKGDKEKQPSCHMYGKISISDLLQNLAAHGLSAGKVEEPCPGSFIIHLVTLNVSFVRSLKIISILLGKGRGSDKNRRKRNPRGLRRPQKQRPRIHSQMHPIMPQYFLNIH